MSIVRRLQGRRFALFEELFDPHRGVQVMVVTFIALLELARESLLGGHPGRSLRADLRPAGVPAELRLGAWAAEMIWARQRLIPTAPRAGAGSRRDLERRRERLHGTRRRHGVDVPVLADHALGVTSRAGSRNAAVDV